MSEAPSNKPYLIRALHQWCVDYGFTPYIAVFVTDKVQVPMDYVNNNEIVLNISPDACQSLSLDNDWISLQARFAGVPRDIHVPVSSVMAIYAKENGQGMSFPVEKVQPSPTIVDSGSGNGVNADANAQTNRPISKGKPSLKLVK
jgi:stringent starvation protein B